MAPLLKSLSVSFALAGGLLKRNKKSKNPSLSHLSGGARHPRREREQCEVEEAQLQIGRLFKRWQEEERNSCFASFTHCSLCKRAAYGSQVLHSPWPWLPSPSWGDIWPAHVPPSQPFFTLGCGSSSWLSLSWWWYHAVKLIPKLVKLGIN